MGSIDGKIIGEDLKSQKTVILQPNTFGNSYAWVYTPGGAIFYRCWNHDHRGKSTRHSQFGSGKPVQCAGEFTIGQFGHLETVLVMMNDASGDYTPKGSECLGPVAAKLESLDINLKDVHWVFRE